MKFDLNFNIFETVGLLFSNLEIDYWKLNFILPPSAITSSIVRRDIK